MQSKLISMLRRDVNKSASSAALSVRTLKLDLTDEKLYEKCRFYGAKARFWRQKFIGLLPEVNRRRLFEKKGFSSIFEFAFKLCGLSAEQVRLTLNLEKRFEDKPILKQMLENGEASINKLARVVSIATPENEEELAAQIKVLPISALNTLVRDEKYARAQTGDLGNADGLLKPLFEDKGLYVHASFSKNRQAALRQTQACDSGAQGLPGQHARAEASCDRGSPARAQNSTALNFEIDDDIKTELNELHSKGIDANELLRKMLKQRREKIAQEKQEIAEKIQGTVQENKPTQSRYIPIAVRKLLREEHGEKCSIPTCHKPARVIHHSQRFSLSQNHDPRFMAPLCEEHHAIAHSLDIKYQRAKTIYRSP